jgi:hypothetical protein
MFEWSTIILCVFRPKDALVMFEKRWGLAIGDFSARKTFIPQPIYKLGRRCEKGCDDPEESPAPISTTEFDVKCSQMISKPHLSSIKQP